MPKKSSLIPSLYYHIFNRGNNRDRTFYKKDNYHYFLRLYRKHVHPITETYAYALLPNHYHFIVKVKPLEELPEEYSAGNKKLSQAFSNWQNAYTKAINKQEGRVSSLFESRFERVEIKSDNRFTNLITYVHFNPEKHGYINDFRKYTFTSYPAMLSEKPTDLKRDLVLEWFGGKSAFENYHLTFRDEWKYNKRNLLDDYD